MAILLELSETSSSFVRQTSCKPVLRNGELADGFGTCVQTLDGLQKAKNARNADWKRRVICRGRHELYAGRARDRRTRPPASLAHDAVHRDGPHR